MAKPTLTVTTDIGTFTRQTARTYTHVVVAKGYRAELIESYRQAEIKRTTKDLATYRLTVATGQCQDARPGASGNWDREMTAQHLADGSYARYIADAEAELARLTAMQPITEDRPSWGVSDANLAATPAWFALGWCGRLNLAATLAKSNEASRYRNVRVYEVATGKLVAKVAGL